MNDGTLGDKSRSRRHGTLSSLAIAAMVLLAVLALAAVIRLRLEGSSRVARVGDPAPDLSLPAVSGER